VRQVPLTIPAGETPARYMRLPGGRHGFATNQTTQRPTRASSSTTTFHVKRHGCVPAGDPIARLDAGAREKLVTFADLLTSRAAPRGLIGFAADAVEEQLARSLLLLEVLGRPERLVDVGSGAGLPGIPLLIVLGNGVLLEPRRKAAAFLEEVLRRLDLDGRVLVATAEEAGRGRLRDWGDAVVARAVGSPAAAAELCAPLCALGGAVLLTASPEATQSDLPANVCTALGLGAVDMRSVTASLGATGKDIHQRMLMMSKVAPTPDELPRRPGTARRRPLGPEVRW
jgi:16S rRNA (guanine527-N7)-methyltransferase